MVGIRPDVLPDEMFVPGPLPLLSEGVLLTGVLYIEYITTVSLAPSKEYTPVVLLGVISNLLNPFFRCHVFLHFDLCRAHSRAYILSFFLENSGREVALCSTTTTRK